jgi:hypothetical protein
VWRAALGAPPYAAERDTIRALVSDDAVDLAIPVWPRADIRFVADRLVEIALA